MVWYKVSELVREGSVSDIIKALIRDKKNGGHWALRIRTE